MDDLLAHLSNILMTDKQITNSADQSKFSDGTLTNRREYINRKSLELSFPAQISCSITTTTTTLLTH